MNHLVNSAVPWSQRFFLENFLRAKASREAAKTSLGSLSLTLRKNFKRTSGTIGLAPTEQLTLGPEGLVIGRDEQKPLSYKLMKVISAWRGLGSFAMNTSSFYVFV